MITINGVSTVFTVKVYLTQKPILRQIECMGKHAMRWKPTK